MSKRRLKKLLQKNTDILKDIALVYFYHYKIMNKSSLFFYYDDEFFGIDSLSLINLKVGDSSNLPDADFYDDDTESTSIWLFHLQNNEVRINDSYLHNSTINSWVYHSNDTSLDYYKSVIKEMNKILKDPWGINGQNRKKIKVTKK